MQVQSIPNVSGVRINLVHDVRWKVNDSREMNIPLSKSNRVLAVEASILWINILLIHRRKGLVVVGMML